MAFGDLPLDAPEKPNKGLEGGACNRRSCQREPALWYNHGSYAWYCDECRRDIEFDPVNKRGWDLQWLPECGHPQFETREMMTLREIEKARTKIDDRLYGRGPDPEQPAEYRGGRIRGQKTHSPSLERMLGRRPRHG
jgi:hypothetical protein